MELLQAIALLCQVSSGALDHQVIAKEQLWCQQALLHCVNVKKAKMGEAESLEKCVMEKR